MDIIETFIAELKSVQGHKPPISKSKIKQIRTVAINGLHHYKHIVLATENFVRECKPEYKLSALYVIDSIVRRSIRQFGLHDVYSRRFAINLERTFEVAFYETAPNERNKIIRLLNLWKNDKIFQLDTLGPLFVLANKTMQDYIKLRQQYCENSAMNQRKYKQSMCNTSVANTSRPSAIFTGNVSGSYSIAAPKTPKDNSIATSVINEPSNFPKRDSRHQHRPEITETSKPGMVKPKLDRHERLDYRRILLEGQAYRRNKGISPDSSPASKIRLPVEETCGKDREDNRTTDSSDLTISSDRDPSQAPNPIGTDIPPPKEQHLTVCSSTIWLGHLPRGTTLKEISDILSEYGTINSIDIFAPRGCTYAHMDRRIDAHEVLNNRARVKLRGSQVKIAWAPGKGLNVYKTLARFWNPEVGASFIPYTALDSSVDLLKLGEGGFIDKASMTPEMRTKFEEKVSAAQSFKHSEIEENPSLDWGATDNMNQSLQHPQEVFANNFKYPPPQILQPQPPALPSMLDPDQQYRRYLELQLMMCQQQLHLQNFSSPPVPMPSLVQANLNLGIPAHFETNTLDQNAPPLQNQAQFFIPNPDQHTPHGFQNQQMMQFFGSDYSPISPFYPNYQ